VKPNKVRTRGKLIGPKHRFGVTGRWWCGMAWMTWRPVWRGVNLGVKGGGILAGPVPGGVEER
jgi:hypothetical protein